MCIRDRSTSCHRVPVVDGHTEAVFMEMDENFELDDVKKSLKDYKALPQKLNLYSAPKNPIIVREEDNRPQPRMDRMMERGMAVTVGRLRIDANIPKSLKYVLFCLLYTSHYDISGIEQRRTRENLKEVESWEILEHHLLKEQPKS